MLVLKRSDESRYEQYETVEAMLARECRRISLRGPIVDSPLRTDYMGSTQITEAILALNRLDASEPIWLFLNSGGGSIDAAFIVYDTIRMSSAPVYTVGEMCASAATLLLAAGAKRFIYPHTRTMLHLPSGSIEGDVREISIRTTEFQRVRDGLVDAYIDCGVRKTREQVLSDIDREMWMSPGETIGYGLADTVIDAATLFGECIGERVK